MQDMGREVPFAEFDTSCDIGGVRLLSSRNSVSIWTCAAAFACISSINDLWTAHSARGMFAASFGFIGS